VEFDISKVKKRQVDEHYSPESPLDFENKVESDAYTPKDNKVVNEPALGPDFKGEPSTNVHEDDGDKEAYEVKDEEIIENDDYPFTQEQADQQKKKGKAVPLPWDQSSK
jgi:hypothetical protein